MDQKNAGMPLFSDLFHEIYSVLFAKSAWTASGLWRVVLLACGETSRSLHTLSDDFGRVSYNF